MTWHIHIRGQVQGVGFRPFVFLLATELNLTGNVRNSPDGVHILLNAEPDMVQHFLNQIQENAPKHAKITELSTLRMSKQQFDKFEIVHSAASYQANLLITPDIAICDECRSDIKDKQNKRHNYPFTTCTNCGPRYSIIEALPYDREHTTMQPFEMCPECNTEYDDPFNRRYYSQTNSCPMCRVDLQLYQKSNPVVNISQAQIIDKVIAIWKAGGIVAIKGLGGYLLTCDPSNTYTIRQLRERKHRPTKPLAVMMTSSQLQQTETLTPTKKQMLAFEHSTAPIVLIKINKTVVSEMALEDLAPELTSLGVMRDYTPLYSMLLETYKKPIVATSANLSGAPIIYEDEHAIQKLSTIADFVLANNRKIIVPQDDSVIRYTPFHQQKILLRRSRGLAPTFTNHSLNLKDQHLLATGAHMKSTFCLVSNGNTYLSQYLGTLEDYDALVSYKSTIEHLLSLLKIQPEAIIVDQHKAYQSTMYGNLLASQLKIPTYTVQHHEAHFAALLGEHNKVNSHHPILGIIWDGTGAGKDGNLWGGEFMTYQDYVFERTHHFNYFSQISGDKMAKEPRLSALSIAHKSTLQESTIEEKFSPTELKIYKSILRKNKTPKTSSVGRLFDAVASILGIKDKQTYEGEASSILESVALQYFYANGRQMKSHYPLEVTNEGMILTTTLFKSIISDLENNYSTSYIAAKFHYSLVEVIKNISSNLKIRTLAFSGGVFQNALLVDLIKDQLQNHCELLFHKELPPNDENISFGQVVHYHIATNKALINQSKKSVQCV